MASDATLLGSAGDTFKSGGIQILSEYGWILWFFVGLAIVFAVGAVLRMLVMRKKQWTHTLRYKRELPNGYLSKETVIKMRRFPLIKRANVFELETALLGAYLIPEPGQYSDNNEFTITISKDNRIYLNMGEKLNLSEKNVLVSARHAEIDLGIDELKSKYQNINKTQKRVEWAAIAKMAMWGLLIIAIMIVSVKGIGAWADSKETEAQANAAFAQAMGNLAEALETSQATVNGLNILADEIKGMKGTSNIQTIVREVNNETL